MIRMVLSERGRWDMNSQTNTVPFEIHFFVNVEILYNQFN